MMEFWKISSWWGKTKRWGDLDGRSRHKGEKKVSEEGGERKEMMEPD